MITVDQMVRVTRKGGTVTHLALTSGVPSVCGRVALFGPAVPEARLCKTCARIARVADSEGDWTEAEQAFITMRRTGEAWEMLADTVSDYEAGEENDPHRIALYRAALAKRNYATTVITNNPDSQRRSTDGNKMGYGKAKQMGATENQRTAILRMANYLDSLTNQLFELREMSLPETGIVDMYTSEFFDALNRKQIDQHFKSLSSAIEGIKEKLSVERIQRRKADTPVSATVLQEDEIFVLNGEYYKTKKSKAGHLYAMRWDGERWDYESAKGVIRKLTPEMRATAEQASEFGHTYHCCVYCSRGLNDSRSETVGYGPICADKYGLPWGE